MKLSTKYRLRGFLHGIRGTGKGIVAKLSANRALGTRGKIERLFGKLQGRVGKVHRLVGL